MPELQQVSVVSYSFFSQDFGKYLEHYNEIMEFERTKNQLTITFSAKEAEERLEVQTKQDKSNSLQHKKERTACRGICRDGTNCLNKAISGKYCWKHQQ